MRILIVDGAKDRRRDLTLALAELDNVTVQGAVSDVRSAMVALAETSPDVLITHTTLPDGDGTYLLERMRALTRMPSIIVLGAAHAPDERVQYLSSGADSYVDASDFDGVCAAVVGLSATRHALGSIPPQDSQRLLGRMTAGIVHDFNNYLHAADVSLELMERQGHVAELLANARTALDTMKRLNATLLSYARGGVPAALPLHLGAVVNETLSIVRRLIDGDIAVSVSVDDNVRPIHAVRTEIEQVVINLILNACDAMPDGGRLDLVVKQATSQAVLLEVSDSGHGFNGAAEPKPGRHGAGLGLTIVRNVISRHGGALRMVARKQGGTTVAIMLPTATPVS